MCKPAHLTASCYFVHFYEYCGRGSSGGHASSIGISKFEEAVFLVRIWYGDVGVQVFLQTHPTPMSLGGLRGSGVIQLDVVTRSDPGAENDTEYMQTLSRRECLGQPGWLHKSGRLSESS